jgi:hypothetical protein
VVTCGAKSGGRELGAGRCAREILMKLLTASKPKRGSQAAHIEHTKVDRERADLLDDLANLRAIIVIRRSFLE